MKFLIEEMFKLKAQNPEMERTATQNINEFMKTDAYNNLIEDLLKQNQSWDQLLLQNNFRLTKSAESISSEGYFNSEKSFYEVLVGGNSSQLQDLGKYLEAETNRQARLYQPTPSPMKQETVRYSFDDADTRIAGILATPRFFARYGNTALNKNRRRAAVIFHVFLCDTMVPVVPPASDENNKNDINLVVGQKVAEEQITAHTQVDLHGSQADCRACHDKLDPMGQVFSGSNYRLSPAPSSGALFYKRAGKSPVSIKVEGPRGLAKAIVAQDEYLKCQVQHFWNWFIGEDVPLTDARQSLLMKQFDAVGRKPVDFVKYLVNQEEFKAAPRPLNENQILARRAIKIAKTCNSCHVQKEDDMTYYWDVSAPPFGNSLQSRRDSIEEMQKQLDVMNGGKNAKMPPRSSQWKPTAQEYQTLKKWLEVGAPGLDGKSQLEGL